MALDVAAIAAQLLHVGYIVLEQPLLKELSDQLLSRCQDHRDDRFQAARIGRGTSRHHAESLRGDAICWLHQGNLIDNAYLTWMEQLRLGLNENLQLGLFDYESHYAIYGVGSRYAKHSDALKGSRNRVVSTVFYLNGDWKARHGGELILFESLGESRIATINPTFGRMVIFLSESVPHEVLVAQYARRSIAGWFRVREQG